MADRGMKKWNPFKSLNGQFDMIDKLQKEKEKIEKPILSSDQLDKLNSVLSGANIGDIFQVDYYNNGHINSEELILKKIDLVEKTIYFEDKKLNITDILDLKLI